MYVCFIDSFILLVLFENMASYSNSKQNRRKNNDTIMYILISLQMAHIVGVPKREPCKHCGLPVFFAERLNINGSLYHRKCLRCARCDSQLTPGSFYETEVDDVFCCDVCPDEEKKIPLDNNNVEHLSVLSTQAADERRQSFSDKLAMFQSKNGKGLLQKSLSDEEKSKSLKRLTELYSKNCADDTNDIRHQTSESSDSQIDDGKNDDEITDDTDVITFDSINEDNDNDPPSLPKSLPPSFDPVIEVGIAKPKLPPIPSKANVLNKLYGNSEIKKKHQGNVKSDASTSNPNNEKQTNVEILTDPNEQSSQITCNASEEKHMDTSNALKTVPQIDDEKMNSIESNLNTNNSLPLDALNSSTNVTKENTEFIEQMTYQQNDNVHHLEDKRDFNSIDNDDGDNSEEKNYKNNSIERSTNIKSVSRLESLTDGSNHSIENTNSKQEIEQEKGKNEELLSIGRNGCNENKPIDVNIDKYDTNELETIIDLRVRSSSISDNDSQKMVRSRLSQFEALVQSSPELKLAPHHSPRLNRNSIAAENVRRQCNERKNAIDGKINVTNATEAIPQMNVELEPSTRLSLNVDDENNVESNASINADSDKIFNTLETNDFDLKKPVPRQRAALNIHLDEDAAPHPPTPSKRRQKGVASSEKLADKYQMNKSSSNFEPKELPHSSISIENNEVKNDEMKYPNGLNPFGSDDEQDANDEENYSLKPIQKRRENLNPFDSEDDEIELLRESSTPKNVPTNHR